MSNKAEDQRYEDDRDEHAAAIESALAAIKTAESLDSIAESLEQLQADPARSFWERAALSRHIARIAIFTAREVPADTASAIAGVAKAADMMLAEWKTRFEAKGQDDAK